MSSPMGTQRTQTGGGRWSEMALEEGRPGELRTWRSAMWRDTEDESVLLGSIPEPFQGRRGRQPPPCSGVLPGLSRVLLPWASTGRQWAFLCIHTSASSPCLLLLSRFRHHISHLDNWEHPLVRRLVLCLLPMSSYPSLFFTLLSDLLKMQFRPCYLSWPFSVTLHRLWDRTHLSKAGIQKPTHLFLLPYRNIYFCYPELFLFLYKCHCSYQTRDGCT